MQTIRAIQAFVVRCFGIKHAARQVVVVGFVASLAVALAPTASAHTDFESSDPADGAVLAVPISKVTVRFTAPSLIAGDGFVVLSPDGELLSPEVAIGDEQREFTLLFDPPLVGGEVGVRWSVRAGDAHPIEGAFSFTTTAAAASIQPPAQPEPESESDTTPNIEPSDANIAAPEPPMLEPADANIAAPEPSMPASSMSESAVEAGGGEVGGSSSIVGDEVAPVPAESALDDFLRVKGEDPWAERFGFVARLLSLSASLLAIGVVLFVRLHSPNALTATSLFVRLVAVASVAILVGGVLEAAALRMSLGTLSDALSGSHAVAIGLRLAGAALLLAAVVPRISQHRSRGVGGWIGPIVGAGLLAASFIFDGHTVTKGNRIATAVADLVHVIGGSIWLGGLVCLVALSRSARPCSDPNEFAALVLRFSVTAAAALGAAGLAGLILTVTVLDTFSDLWATAWGRLLIAKVLVVGLAIVTGAYNHWVLVPKLQSDGGAAAISLKRTMTIEVAALAAAVAVTAALVGASA